MRLLWIGSYASDEMFDNMKAKSIGQASGVTSQRSFISGIDKCLFGTNTVLDTINIQGVPSFPKSPEKRYTEVRWSRNGNSSDLSVGFRNTRFLKPLTQAQGLIDAAKEWIKDVPKDEKVIVFLYEPVLNRLKAVETIKKKHSKTVCCLIVPDVPEFVGVQGNPVKQKLKAYRKKIVDSKLKYIDKYVFYAKSMAEYYHVESNKCCIIEGSIDLRDAEQLSICNKKSEIFTLLYSGSVSRNRGIDQFVRGFCSYKHDRLSLWFTGAGDYDDELLKVAKSDSRITHFGLLQTRNEVLEKEAQADVLLHIRRKDEPSSTYCFPSKLFEYLASGKPVISVRIPGIPEEYYQYLIEIPELNDQGIRQAIEKVLSMSETERISFGQRGRDFVLKEKNSVVQAKKLLQFVIS